MIKLLNDILIAKHGGYGLQRRGCKTLLMVTLTNVQCSKKDHDIQCICYNYTSHSLTPQTLLMTKCYG